MVLVPNILVYVFVFVLLFVYYTVYLNRHSGCLILGSTLCPVKICKTFVRTDLRHYYFLMLGHFSKVVSFMYSTLNNHDKIKN